MTVEIKQSARADLLSAGAFYNEQEPGLGDEVIDFLEHEIRQLDSTAGIHRSFGKFHRCVVQGRFPYFVIYYKIIGEFVTIEAVIDHRRDPMWIKRTLRRRS